MLKILLLFALLIAGIVLGPMIAGHQGYVLIQTDNYNIETSVTGLVIILILAMVVLFAIEWLLRRIFRTGAHTRGWFVGRKRRRARKQTEQALLKLAEGDYQQVEKLMAKNADHAEIGQRAAEHGGVFIVEILAQRFRAAAEIADAHRARVGVAAHLAERLHLHGTDERHKHIGRHVPLLRQKADEKEQHDLREDDELPPVDLFHALKAPVDALGNEYPEREREHRHEIAHGARRVALKKIGAQKDDVAGLGVGKHLAAAEIGIGVLQSSG